MCDHCSGNEVLSKQKMGEQYDDIMFAGVVSAIEDDTLLPKILELVLRIPTFKPMKALIHQFGGLGSYCSHGEALGSDVVGGDGSGNLLDVAKYL
jgi:hypothetical protein